MEFQLDYIFPIITSTISFLFFLSVSEQYVRKRRPHQLVWSVSMFLFFITAGAEAVSLIIGSWNPIVYRTYYLFAAIQVSLMGGGLIYLFTTHNVINERNAAKASIIFGSVWVLFSNLFLQRDNIFLVVLIPTLILVLGGVLYQIISNIDKFRFKNSEKLLLCLNCRKEYPITKTEWPDNKRVMEINQSSTYTKFYHRLFRGHNFAHFFIGMAVYLFLLMNLYVWTLPLNEELLATGKEVSGTAWQKDASAAQASLENRALIRLFSPLHTVPGAVALIGGGIYSYISWQKFIKKSKGKFEPLSGIYNIYIAFGAWVLGLGATLSGFGLGTLYISEVISVTFMYFGFLESDTISKDKFLSIFNVSWIWKKEQGVV
ncbi:MAG: hypothetical protein GPJ54_02945 [Candidatus Heimdallarchaeota archaeon]|nr:hypothetical protein [Candidatus Heimdallarchaeota archaeon]